MNKTEKTLKKECNNCLLADMDVPCMNLGWYSSNQPNYTRKSKICISTHYMICFNLLIYSIIVIIVQAGLIFYQNAEWFSEMYILFTIRRCECNVA